MGKPFVHVHKGVTVKFCCEGCLDEFNDNPEKYLAKLEAVKKGEKTKPTEENPEEGKKPTKTEGDKKEGEEE